MLRTIRFVVAMTFFLIIYVTTLAPAIEDTSTAVQAADSGGPLGMYGSVETALFVGLPMVMLGGILVIGFVIAVGIRGTSFR
jgi:hypothetical protein